MLEENTSETNLEYVDEQALMNEFNVTIKCTNEEEKEDVMSRLNIKKRTIKYKDYIECQE